MVVEARRPGAMRAWLLDIAGLAALLLLCTAALAVLSMLQEMQR